VCSGDNDDGDHVNEEKQRQEKEGNNKHNNDQKLRNRMESRTHGIILVKTTEDGRKLWGPNKEKYDIKDKVLAKEYR